MIEVPQPRWQHSSAWRMTLRTEGRAAPVAPGDELKRASGNLLPGSGDSDDDRGAPAAMAAFQCLAHDFDIADAFESEPARPARDRCRIRFRGPSHPAAARASAGRPRALGLRCVRTKGDRKSTRLN